jgi:hypothetical protein
LYHKPLTIKNWVVRKTDIHQRAREYLAYIGSLGGGTSRRYLSKSHARQMVAIREMQRAAIKAGKPWPPRDPKTLRLLKLK